MPIKTSELRAVATGIFLQSLALILFELLLTRIFAVVLFASFAHLALALALLGIGVGAVAQHLWPRLVPQVGARERLGWLGLGLGVTAVLAVLAALNFPLLNLPKEAPDTYQDTSSLKEQILRPGWFAALLPLLSIPFAFGGLSFAGAFQRYREHIGRIYAADLIGGAIGAVIFIPALSYLSGPDTVFLVLWISGIAGVVLHEQRFSRRLSGAVAVLGLGLVIGGAQTEILEVHETSGFNEAQVTYTRWTALTRLAVFEDPDGSTEDPAPKVLVLLDNASASEIPMDEASRTRMVQQENRSLVYRLHSPDARVAILAASAGPEVAVAQHYGFHDIDAIDIAGDIFEIVATRFPNSPVNPYLQKGVHGVQMDGRAAILQAQAPYDIIQMVHANLWSAAGILANTWSPALLETQEAFTTYLDKLTPDGTLSFGRGSDTDLLARSAAAALRARGVTEPWKAMAYFTGKSRILLIKGRPWTTEELARLETAYDHQREALSWNPADEKPPKSFQALMHGPLITDDRPYVDTFSSVAGALNDVQAGKKDTPLAALYQSLLVQLSFVLAAGVIFVALPWALRGRSEARGVQGGILLLSYVAALGYGYLSVETTLVHALVLFVGHPTWAITVVVLAMLLSSGLGSALAERIPQSDLGRRLPQILVAILILGVITGVLLPPQLFAHALFLPLWFRLSLTFVGLFPLGLMMGMPFPMAVRLLPEKATGIVPWAWAINGWMSVVASLATVVIARLFGYTSAFELALGAYVLALGLSFTFKRITTVD